MKKYSMKMYVQMNVNATILANSEAEAHELFRYAWNTEECLINVHDLDILESEEVKENASWYPVLDVESCRKEVLENMEYDQDGKEGNK